MAKELPYFKFEPAEYLTKDVSFCSLSAQGLFINLCAYYWQRGCKLTKPQLLKRMNHEEELNELINEGVIDLKSDDIFIKFLDNQLKEVVNTSKVNSVNGSKGGRPKKPKLNPNESETKAKLNPNINPIESQTKGIREDKIRIDNTSSSKNNHDNYFNECIKSDEWQDHVCMNTKIKKELIPKALKDFNSHLIADGENKMNLTQYKSHFVRWVRKLKNK